MVNEFHTAALVPRLLFPNAKVQGTTHFDKGKPMLNPEFVDADPRCACLLLLDTSTSMKGQRIDALNAGLKAFEDDIKEDPLARRRVEIAIVTFGGVVNKLQDFVLARDFNAPTLIADGGTPMGEAITLGIQLVKDRKVEYKSNGVIYYQPWVFLITDGEPTDQWESAARLARAEASAKALTFFAVAVGEVNTAILSAITDRVVRLDGVKFRELFLWVSQSTARVSKNKVTDQTALPPVNFAAPVGG
jgi:uncharacterized protein YegL